MISWIYGAVDEEAGPGCEARKSSSGQTGSRLGVIRNRKSWALLLAAFFWVGLASLATAADPRLEGEGILGERNLSERSLVIGGAIYFFAESSVIEGRAGETLMLEDLEVHDAGAEPGLLPVLSGRFSATEVGSRFFLLLASSL